MADEWRDDRVERQSDVSRQRGLARRVVEHCRVGDFNGDGDTDILWRQSTTGSLAMWLMNGSTIESSANVTYGGSAVAPGSTWNVVEVGEFNGGNTADILWRQSTTGTLAEWQMNGAQIVSSQSVTSTGTLITPDGSWQVQAKPTDFV